MGHWQVAEQNLRSAAVGAGISELKVGRHRVEDDEEAERLQFIGSPTLLLDGVDPFADPEAPVGPSSRLHRTPSGVTGAPTTSQLRDAIERHIRTSSRA